MRIFTSSFIESKISSKSAAVFYFSLWPFIRFDSTILTTCSRVGVAKKPTAFICTDFAINSATSPFRHYPSSRGIRNSLSSLCRPPEHNLRPFVLPLSSSILKGAIGGCGRVGWRDRTCVCMCLVRRGRCRRRRRLRQGNL
jgi:hypothetical protein